jgi:hypothetical protein
VQTKYLYAASRIAPDIVFRSVNRRIEQMRKRSAPLKQS